MRNVSHVTASAFLTVAVYWVVQPAMAQDHPLLMTVRPAKKSAYPKYAKTLSEAILYPLFKEKVPGWEFLDSQVIRNTDDSGMVNAENKNAEDRRLDAVIEFESEDQNVEGSDTAKIVILTISVRDPVRDKLLFSKIASSRPRPANRTGELNAARMEAVKKVMRPVVNWLKDYHQDINNNGRWCRVMLENAPATLADNVEEKLKASCHKVERLSSGATMDVQCKLDSLELAALLHNVVESSMPDAKYDFREKMTRTIIIAFDVPSGKKPKKTKKKRKKGRK